MATVRRAMVLAGLLLAPGIARAGRTDYGWLFGSEVIPERSVELQQWLWEEDNNNGALHTKEDALWWGPVIGLTDQLELGLPVQFEWTQTDGTNRKFTLDKFGFDLRYRFVSQDPVDKPAFAPLLRIAAWRDVSDREGFTGEADLVGTYDFTDSVQAAVDLGFSAYLHDEKQYALRPGVGVSVKAVDDVRFGAEAYAAISTDNSQYTWAVVGPNMAVTHGRFWLSASFGIGVYHIDYAPRVIWGVLF